MKIEKVLDFRTFHKLNEADESSATMGAADQIVNLFFSAFGAIATKIGGYDEMMSDLLKVAEAKVEDKGKVMSEMISKVSSKVDPKFEEAGNEMILVGKKIKDAYEILISTKQGEDELKSINDKIYKKILAFRESTKSAAEESKDSKIEVKESFEITEGDALYEKSLFDKTFTKERNELISNIVPILSLAAELADNAPTQQLKDICKKKAQELKKLRQELSEDNEKWWESKKRKERVTRLEEISKSVNSIPVEIQNAQLEAIRKLGLDKKIQSAIDAASEAFSNAVVALNKEQEKKLEDSAEKKAEQAKEKSGEDKETDKEKSEKQGEPEEITSGTIDVTNLKKSGKNRDAIRDIQKKMNVLLGDDDQIKDDGLYGQNTEKAIKTIASQYSSISPEIKGLDGKKMTPGFIKFLNNFEKNKDKIANLFK